MISKILLLETLLVQSVLLLYQNLHHNTEKRYTINSLLECSLFNLHFVTKLWALESQKLFWCYKVGKLSTQEDWRSFLFSLKRFAKPSYSAKLPWLRIYVPQCAIITQPCSFILLGKKNSGGSDLRTSNYEFCMQFSIRPFWITKDRANSQTWHANIFLEKDAPLCNIIG